MSRRTIGNLLKYLLAFGLLTWVVYSNWAPPNDKARVLLGASTTGLLASPLAGPLTAVVAAVPGRLDSKGLGYVWYRHVVCGQPLNGHFFTIAFLIYSAAIVLTLLRWYILVRAQDLPFRVRDALRLGMIGVFFNAFLPGSVGGDIIKAAAIAGEQNRRTVAVATVIMDRVIALWALVWLVAICGIIFWTTGLIDEGARFVSRQIIYTSIVIVVCSTTVWFLLGLLSNQRAERFACRLERIPKVGSSAAEFWRAVWMYRCRQKSVALVMLLSWIGHIGFVLAFFCAANTLWSEELGPIPTLTQHFLIVPIGLVMQALVPTPGGAGGAEWIFGGLYLLFGASEANGVLGALAKRMIDWTLGLVGFGVYMRLRAGQLPTTIEETTTIPALAAESES